MLKFITTSLTCGCLCFFSIHLNAQTIPAYVPLNGLVGYYPLDGNANDLSSSNNSGTLTGCTSVLDRNGKLNGAYNFNGTSDFITVSDAASLNPGSAITISAWIKASNFGVNVYDNTIVGKDTWTGGNKGYTLRCGDGGKLSFNIAKSINTWTESVTLIPLLSTSDWFFVTGVYDGTMLSTYINGALVMAAPNTGAMITSTVPLLIGSCPGPSSPRFFSGKIDEVAIWNRALTQLEITSMFIGALPPVTCMPAYVPTLGLSAWWPFCGTADDLSFNGNHGSVSNATLTADRNGAANSAYDFDGSSSFIRVFDSNTLDLKDNYTLAGWFKSNDQVSSQPQTVLGKGRQSGGTGYALSYANNPGPMVTASANDGNSYNGGVSGSVVGSGIWHHMAVTYNGSTAKLYVDGFFSSSTAATYSLQNSTEPLFIGKELTSLPRFFNGKLDDIGIWTRALNADEILSLFSGAIIVSTSLEKETEEQHASIYPNPASTLLTLQASSSTIGCEYAVKDIAGRELLHGTIDGTKEKIDIQKLDAGLYFVSIHSNTQQAIKFVKE